MYLSTEMYVIYQQDCKHEHKASSLPRVLCMYRKQQSFEIKLLAVTHLILLFNTSTYMFDPDSESHYCPR